MAPKYRLVTLGCKVNQYESQVVRECLEAHGWHGTLADEDADLAIVNTCAVTEEAVRQSRRLVRRLGANGTTRVVVIGCAATSHTETFRRMDGVSAVWPHTLDVPSRLQEYLAALPPDSSGGRAPDGTCSDTEEVLEAASVRRRDEGDDVRMSPTRSSAAHAAAPEPRQQEPTQSIALIPRHVKQNDILVTRIRRFAGHQRAFLKIQDGCDAWCSYCIIPRLRAQVRSKPPELVMQEARELVANGFTELVLTGIFLGAYGRPTAVRRRWAGRVHPLIQLICAIAQIEGLERLRLSSLEPGDVGDELLDALAAHPKCVPHLHLPLQSGSSRILKRMNRQYSVEDYVGMIDRVRAALDRPAITTDLIVGFPGETEGDFQASLDTARFAQFCGIHAFPFSAREGTAADRWRDEAIHATEVRRRMGRLADVERECSLMFRRQFVGSVQRVIVERTKRKSPDAAQAMRHGRTDRYFEVHFEAQHTRTADTVRVRIDGVTPTRTHGSLISTGVDRALPVLEHHR